MRHGAQDDRDPRSYRPTPSSGDGSGGAGDAWHAAPDPRDDRARDDRAREAYPPPAAARPRPAPVIATSFDDLDDLVDPITLRPPPRSERAARRARHDSPPELRPSQPSRFSPDPSALQGWSPWPGGDPVRRSEVSPHRPEAPAPYRPPAPAPSDPQPRPPSPWQGTSAPYPGRPGPQSYPDRPTPPPYSDLSSPPPYSDRSNPPPYSDLSSPPPYADAIPDDAPMSYGGAADYGRPVYGSPVASGATNPAEAPAQPARPETDAPYDHPPGRERPDGRGPSRGFGAVGAAGLGAGRPSAGPVGPSGPPGYGGRPPRPARPVRARVLGGGGVSDPHFPGSVPFDEQFDGDRADGAAGPGDDSEPEIESDGTYRGAAVAALVWCALPVVLYVAWALVLSGRAEAGCIDDNGQPCASPQVTAWADLLHAAPLISIAVVLSMVIALMLRRITSGWRSTTVGFASSVVAAGVVTVVWTALVRT